ncbi:MAG: thiosulfate oxidation carrier protein SoxY [Methylomonas sp.]|nr:MAG: thiosulfate oxidation carrier protein SoxY [Methylomonas sp.]
MLRRVFLKTLSRYLSAVLGSLAFPKHALSKWPEQDFAAGDFSDKFREIFADLPISDSQEIIINLPEIAENGAVVPITISSALPNIKRLYIWAEKNPTPLVAEFEFDESMMLFLTARIKMAESCPVIVIAQQGDQLLRNQKWVTVMQGGCGTG